MLSTLFTKLRGCLALVAIIGLLGSGSAGTALHAEAVEFGDFEVATGDSDIGGTEVSAVGKFFRSIGAVVNGPVILVVLGIVILVSVGGFAMGQMKVGFIGLGAFVLAAALFGLLKLVIALMPTGDGTAGGGGDDGGGDGG